MSRDKSIEQELKYALSASGYQKLIRQFDPSGVHARRQVNAYFDDERGRLRRRHIGLRIRVIDEKSAEMTIKFPTDAVKRHGLSTREEIETSLPLATARTFLAGRSILKSPLKPIATLKARVPEDVLTDIQFIGTLSTARTKVKYQGLTLEIDACEVFGKKFYELEIETTNPARARKIVHALLKEHGQKTRPLDRSKLARFWKEYRLSKAR